MDEIYHSEENLACKIWIWGLHIKWMNFSFEVQLNLAIIYSFPGGWGKIKIKDHLSPAEAETWAELGNIPIFPPFFVSLFSKSMLHKEDMASNSSTSALHRPISSPNLVNLKLLFYRLLSFSWNNYMHRYIHIQIQSVALELQDSSSRDKWNLASSAPKVSHLWTRLDARALIWSSLAST